MHGSFRLCLRFMSFFRGGAGVVLKIISSGFNNTGNPHYVL